MGMIFPVGSFIHRIPMDELLCHKSGFEIISGYIDENIDVREKAYSRNVNYFYQNCVQNWKISKVSMELKLTPDDIVIHVDFVYHILQLIRQMIPDGNYTFR